MKFKQGTGNWTEYRKLKPHWEVDFHEPDYGGYAQDEPPMPHWLRQELGEPWPPEREPPPPYYERMEDAADQTLDALKGAYEHNIPWVLFTHGHSTSRNGKTTKRSVVRGVMRSKQATPYIIRGECIQHYSVFVARIRPKPSAESPAGETDSSADPAEASDLCNEGLASREKAQDDKAN